MVAISFQGGGCEREPGGGGARSLCVPERESHLDTRARGPPSQPKAGRWNWVNDLISEGLRISVFASKAFESPGRNPCPACPRSHLFFFGCAGESRLCRPISTYGPAWQPYGSSCELKPPIYPPVHAAWASTEERRGHCLKTSGKAQDPLSFIRLQAAPPAQLSA